MFGKGFGHNSGPHPAPEDAAARGPGSAGVQRGLWAARPTSSSPSAPTRALVLGVHAGPSTSSTGEGSTHAASQAPAGLPQPWASPDSLVTQRPPLAWRPYGVLSYSTSYPHLNPHPLPKPFPENPWMPGLRAGLPPLPEEDQQELPPMPTSPVPWEYIWARGFSSRAPAWLPCAVGPAWRQGRWPGLARRPRGFRHSKIPTWKSS